MEGAGGGEARGGSQLRSLLIRPAELAPETAEMIRALLFCRKKGLA